MKNFDVAAVVSGGSSGLGEATTRALAAELGGHTTFVRPQR
jgi:NAD(P)-dependent dehydrogenase (short-subunit alcohol dehydrogenase family)